MRQVEQAELYHVVMFEVGRISLGTWRGMTFRDPEKRYRAQAAGADHMIKRFGKFTFFSYNDGVATELDVSAVRAIVSEELGRTSQQSINAIRRGDNAVRQAVALRIVERFGDLEVLVQEPGALPVSPPSFWDSQRRRQADAAAAKFGPSYTTLAGMIDTGAKIRALCTGCHEYRDIDLSALAAKVGPDYSLVNRRTRCRLSAGCMGWNRFYYLSGVYRPLWTDEGTRHW